jgi:hypothetical protein
MRSVLLRARRSRLFASHPFPRANLWGLGSFGIFGLKNVLIFDIECSTLVSFSTCYPTSHTRTTALRLIINPKSERVNLKLSIPSLAAQLHSTTQHPTLTAKTER